MDAARLTGIRADGDVAAAVDAAAELTHGSSR